MPRGRGNAGDQLRRSDAEPGIQGPGGRVADAHDHVFDRPGGLPEVERRDDLELVREEPLLDEQNSVAASVERDCAEMPGTAIDRDVQVISTFIFRILLSMPW
jgi:hypothetical protein